MKNHKKEKDMEKENKMKRKSVNSEKSTIENLPIKNPMTDNIKKVATQTSGLNQVNTIRDDLFPSDGDNSTI